MLSQIEFLEHRQEYRSLWQAGILLLLMKAMYRELRVLSARLPQALRAHVLLTLSSSRCFTARVESCCRIALSTPHLATIELVQQMPQRDVPTTVPASAKCNGTRAVISHIVV